MNEHPLAGVGVLVTRPRHQAGELREAIENSGGQAVLLPVIDIVPRIAAEVEHDVKTKQTPDIVVFVSANAVRYGLSKIEHRDRLIVAIGAATHRALETAGVSVDLMPTGGTDSEHLLATATLNNVADKRVMIVRGGSGRELLAETLRERGAIVEYLPVYDRKTSLPDADALESVENAWRDGQIDAVMVMSVASLDSLLEILPAYCLQQLQKTRLVAPSARVIQTALERVPGLIGILSPGPGALDMTGALIASLQADPDTDNG